MDYSAAVVVSDGCCLPDCHYLWIIIAREMGRAITIGSIAVHGGTSRVILPKIAGQIPRGFASAASKNAVQRNQMTAPVIMR